MSDHDFHALVACLHDSPSIVVMTGAGASAESGIPTFRDAQEGLWANYSPQDLATEAAFRNNPDTVWQWYEWRRLQISQTEPNQGHYALAQLANSMGNFTLITQNVDGLHQRAGSQNVLEFHGNIFRNCCVDDKRHDCLPVNYSAPEETVNRSNNAADGSPPPCNECGAPCRPAVIWFGESLDPQVMSEAYEKTRSCQLFFSIGTSSQVYPAAELALVAKESGAKLIEINPDETPLSSYCDISLRSTSAKALGSIVAALCESE